MSLYSARLIIITGKFWLSFHRPSKSTNKLFELSSQRQESRNRKAQCNRAFKHLWFLYGTAIMRLVKIWAFQFVSLSRRKAFELLLRIFNSIRRKVFELFLRTFNSIRKKVAEKYADLSTDLNQLFERVYIKNIHANN